MKHFKVGGHVTMTEDACRNYGRHYENRTLVVTVVSKNEKDHPGYYSGMSPEYLYDLKILGGVNLNFSLYDYELERA
jgi:hypothetical protein